MMINNFQFHFHHKNWLYGKNRESEKVIFSYNITVSIIYPCEKALTLDMFAVQSNC